MKKAFTLIELLVVIAIIAILAAILFPVFAQAKVAAKKTAGLSNVKQISTGIQIYLGDYDDVFPRNDDCVDQSSLNPALNNNPFPPNGTGVGCTSGKFYYRLNHFSWQKWVYAYIKNIQIFENPMRTKDPAQWNNNGQIAYGWVLNGAVTGSLDTYHRAANFPRQFRNPFRGGASTGLPSVADAALVLELPLEPTAFLAGASVDSEGVGPSVTVYPIAIKEFWRWRLMKGNLADCIARTNGTQVDTAKAPSGGITVGFADSHAKFLTAGDFLGKTPSKSEYLGVDASSPTAGWTYPTNSECALGTTTTGNFGITAPNIDIPYPMWALGQ